MPQEISEMFRVVDIVGVILNGIIGGMIARRQRFDVVGFAVLAILSALGGGIMRDVLLMSGRPVALRDPMYFTSALAGAGIAYLIHLRGVAWRWFIFIADAIVLGAWAATGTWKALFLGVNWVPAILLGVMTAVGGGMLRDVMAGNVPQVFGGNNLYTVPAILAAGMVSIGFYAHIHPSILLPSAMGLGALLAMASNRFEWRLPTADEDPSPAALRRMATYLRLQRTKDDSNDTD